MRATWIRAVVLAVGCVSAICAEGAPGRTVGTLEEARSLLDSQRPTGALIGQLTLQGCNAHWELRVGSQLTILAVACREGGGLAIFPADGRLSSTHVTGELVTAQLIDIDEDGTPELLTDEVSGSGTGLMMRDYHLYQLAGASINDLWHGLSVSRETRWTAAGGTTQSSEETGFVRFEPSGGGSPARLVHMVTKPGKAGRLAVSRIDTYEWRGRGQLVRAGTP